jgi:DNA-binding beta-propeller fold protein YncE
MTTTETATRVAYNRTVGVAAMLGRGFYYPWASVVGADGRLYVLGRGLDGDPRGVRVTVMDLEEEYHGTFGAYGRDDGQFIWTVTIVQDSRERLFISDEYLNRITILSTDGEFLGKWGETGDREGQLDGPTGIAFDSSDQLLVVDHRNSRVQRFTADGEFLATFGSFGDGDGQLNLPWGAWVDSDDDVYLADWGNDRIQKFTSAGEFVASYGSSGRGEGQFHRPSGVCVDSDRYIYVTDWGNHRLQVLDPEGGFVQSSRGQATTSKWAKAFLDTNDEEAAARGRANLEADIDFLDDDPHEESAHIEKYFWGPTSITLDSDGHLLIVDSNRHRLQVFDITPS